MRNNPFIDLATQDPRYALKLVAVMHRPEHMQTTEAHIQGMPWLAAGMRDLDNIKP